MRARAAAVCCFLLLGAGCARKTDRLLRVCAEPDLFPFSDQAERGFENRIAQLLARELGARVEYAWSSALEERGCDLIVGVPVDAAPSLTTRPYYRSSYVFVTRADRGLYVQSLDDPRLQPLRLGVESAAASLTQALAERALTPRLMGAPVNVIRAVEGAELDVGLVWGPWAGSFARDGGVPLSVSVITAAGFSLDIGLAVGRQNRSLKEELEQALDRAQEAIDGILREYGVPLVSLPSPPSAAKPHSGPE